MWLCNSSIGRKVIMSVTGIVLVLFLTFHACMNVVAIFSSESYNWICAMLGANWYAVAGTAVLAALIAIHFIYAFILTLQNRKARGSNRYAVTEKPVKVEWASQNMLVLGIIVILGLVLHLWNFWYNMMCAELLGQHHTFVDPAIDPGNGAMLIARTFSNPVYTILYLIWFVALWFHLTHGFWSALQTLGLSGKMWLARWRAIGQVWVTVVILLFAATALWFAFCGGCCKAACPVNPNPQCVCNTPCSTECDKACTAPDAGCICGGGCKVQCQQPCGQECKASCGQKTCKGGVPNAGQCGQPQCGQCPRDGQPQGQGQPGQPTLGAPAPRQQLSEPAPQSAPQNKSTTRRKK